MTPYRNLSGRSGVRAYRAELDAISVEFVDGSVYRYTRASAGAAALARMLELARAGRGLSTYISRHVGEGYAERLR
ncbi:hypothetical protein A7A76_19755 [Lysobacter enzymogenes]|uniref:hypothetical protein n=1 Tax=Lysobacter enzymogenes TaxID=69 RepID=UPI0019D2E2D3|nr:hypothetical protein [Lysobacter enzymogenes]MBN7136979.1 hypothetical protein [Lysobacter enzymogenes]